MEGVRWEDKEEKRARIDSYTLYLYQEEEKHFKISSISISRS